MVLKRFLPQNEEFFGHFRAGAANALEVAQLLSEIFTGTEDVDRKVRHLRELEHRGDEITHQVFSALNATFVTPMDREDIAGLASEIDEFVDEMEEVGKRFWLYRLGRCTESASLLTRILIEQAGHANAAMGLLEEVAKNGETLRHHALEIHRLENEADDALNDTLATLYDGVTEVPALIDAIRWSELYGMLEDATDRAEDVGDRLEAIVAKYA